MLVRDDEFSRSPPYQPPHSRLTAGTSSHRSNSASNPFECVIRGHLHRHMTRFRNAGSFSGKLNIVPRQKVSHRTGVALDFCLYISRCRESINVHRRIPCKHYLRARTTRQLGTVAPYNRTAIAGALIRLPQEAARTEALRCGSASPIC